MNDSNSEHLALHPLVCRTMKDACDTSPLVYQIMLNGGCPEDAVVALVNVQTEMVRRMMQLEGIAPRKIKIPDGREMVWRCPDELIPDAPSFPSLKERVRQAEADTEPS